MTRNDEKMMALFGQIGFGFFNTGGGHTAFGQHLVFEHDEGPGDAAGLIDNSDVGEIFGEVVVIADDDPEFSDPGVHPDDATTRFAIFFEDSNGDMTEEPKRVVIEKPLDFGSTFEIGQLQQLILQAVDEIVRENNGDRDWMFA